MRSSLSSFLARKLIVPLTGTLVLGTTLGIAFAPPAAAAGSTPGLPKPALTDVPATDPSAEAARTGHPVELANRMTETSDVQANPDGTYTLHSSRQPVRVRQNGDWHAIDTTLRANSDGGLSPVATTMDVQFSGGGASPLVSLSSGAARLEFSWPSPLPAPTVTGSTATYASVLPGVDLTVGAQPEGYTEALVVRDAAAAANPALRSIRLGVRARALKVAVTPDGVVNATDSKGAVVFAGIPPAMWDSSRSVQLGGVPNAQGPGGGRLTRLTVDAASIDGTASPASTTLILTPPTSSLVGANVHYPVFIDPGMENAQQHFAVAFDGGSHFYDGGIDDLKVGYCDFSNCGSWTNQNARSFFQMDMTALAQPGLVHIYSASVGATEIHGATGCTPQNVRMFTASNINSTNTAWPGPTGDWIDTESSAGGDNCTSVSRLVTFANANVVSYIQGLAGQKLTRANFALVADVEGNDTYWKRFDENPTLTVTYNYYPDAPVERGVTGEVDCTTTHYVSTATPVLTASAHDNNPAPLSVSLTFNVYAAGNTSSPLRTSAAIVKPSDQTAAWTTTPALPVSSTGSSYQYQTTVLNDPVAGDGADQLSSRTAASFYPFTILPAPTAQASATSFDYPSGNWGKPAGSTGTFTLSDGGAANTVGYAYGWDSASNVPSLSASTCNYNLTIGTTGGLVAGGHTATLTVPATLAAGPHKLYVRSFDAAHNMGPTPTSYYSFYIAPSYAGEGATTFEAESLAATALTVNGGTTSTVSAAGDSGGQEESLTGSAVGSTFTFALPANIEADYAIGMEVVSASGGASLDFSIDGNQVLAATGLPLVFDSNRSGRAETLVSLGAAHLTATPSGAASDHTITVRIPDPSAAGLHTAVDFLTAIPVNNVTTSSFTSAMNNKAIGADGSVGANIGNQATGVGFSSVALAHAGWGEGYTVSVGGATFTMPAHNATNGNDNIIASGQTIPFPAAQQMKATAVGLLVAEACRAAGTVENIGTIYYTDNTTSNAYFPAVPDWNVGSASSAALITPYQLSGTSQDSSVHPKLYAIFIPADPAKTIAKIALPNYGTTFVPGTCSTAMHVFAMAPRPASSGWEGAWAAPADRTTTTIGGASVADRTVRMIVHPTSAGGGEVRMRLSNAYNQSPVTIDAATLAAQSGTGAMTVGTPTNITFCAAQLTSVPCANGSTITIPAGADVLSDPATLPSGGSGDLAVSLHISAAVGTVPVHTGGNTTNYLASGNAVANTDGSAFTSTTTDSYLLTALDVTTPAARPTEGTTVVLGDSTTEAGYAASGSSYPSTWADDLPTEYAANGDPFPGGVVNVSQTESTSFWATADQSGTVLESTALNEPNVQTVIVQLGASDILNGTSHTTTETNIKQIIFDTNNTHYGIGNYKRSDGSDFVHVILTTVPALGLAAGDAREAERQQLNADIVNFGSDWGPGVVVVDTDTATADSSNPHQVQAGMLTGGVRNDAYYRAVADTLVNYIPPLF